MPTSLAFSLLYFQALAKMPLVHGLVLVVFNHALLVDIHQMVCVRSGPFAANRLFQSAIIRVHPR
jgi:hypothetical protein